MWNGTARWEMGADCLKEQVEKLKAHRWVRNFYEIDETDEGRDERFTYEITRNQLVGANSGAQGLAKRRH